jgi:aminoglycoside phosphotransferase (APT) family kinase protein
MTYDLFSKISITDEDIQAILMDHHFSVTSIAFFQRNNRVTDFIINKEFMLRFSQNPLPEEMKLKRVKGIKHVPSIHISSVLTLCDCELFYVLVDFILGDSLFNAIHNMTDTQVLTVGEEIAHFIGTLHQNQDAAYDIGHYIGTIPRFKGSWKEGHEQYVQLLHDQIMQLSLDSVEKQTVISAFDALNRATHFLVYQNGARLLHNDLHPQNIIIINGHLAGIIDWECSQYGESDFELAHLIHWNLFSMNSNEKFEKLLNALLSAYQEKFKVPNLEQRLMFYLLEHELNQIIWNPQNKAERLSKIDYLLTRYHRTWLDFQSLF